MKQTIENSDTPSGRAFDLVVIVLVVISLVEFSVETLPGLAPSVVDILKVSELIIVALFTIEYLARIYVTDRKMKFLCSFYGVVDLLAIAPYYIVGVDLRTLRVFRLLRLILIFKLMRYGRAVARFQAAFSIVREELILFAASTAMLLWLAAVGIYYFENPAQPEKFASIFHSLWWAVATLTTVGYGDVYPITLGGKVFTFVILMLGLGVVAVPAGLLASALGKVRQSEGNAEDVT